MSDAPPPAGERSLAVRAEALYLVNLTLLPGIAFLMLWRMHSRLAAARDGFAGQHVRQAFVASIWSGALLVLAVGSLVALGDLHKPGTWIAIITYVICVHSLLVFGGVVGVARAMAGQPWRYPLIGPR